MIPGFVPRSVALFISGIFGIATYLYSVGEISSIENISDGSTDGLTTQSLFAILSAVVALIKFFALLIEVISGFKNTFTLKA